MILAGIPLLIVFGAGALIITLGVFTIKYAKALFKMQKKAYKGIMITQSFALVSALIIWNMSGFDRINKEALVGIMVSLIVIGSVHAYRNRLTE